MYGNKFCSIEGIKNIEIIGKYLIIWRLNNMQYIRINRKACIRDIGEKKFDFDYNKELIEYKYMSGERMSRKEWRKMNKYEKYNSYTEWETSIVKENKHKTEKQLKEFDYYLRNRMNMVVPQKELNVILCSVIFSVITTVLVDQSNIYDVTLIEGHFFASIIAFLIRYAIIILLMGYIILNVMSPVWSSSTETTFLQEYEHVIKAMVKKKY